MICFRSHKWTYTEVKTFKCDMCEKSFSQSGYLTTKKDTQMGVKPFKCDLCEKSFSQSGNLSKINEHIQEWNLFNVICVRGHFHNLDIYS